MIPFEISIKFADVFKVICTPNSEVKNTEFKNKLFNDFSNYNFDDFDSNTQMNASFIKKQVRSLKKGKASGSSNR